MKTIFMIIKVTLFISIFFIALSCNKKENPSPAAPLSTNAKKYEITGNYSGHLTVAYTNASGATESKIVTSLPWSLELTFASSVGGMGLGGNSVVDKTGMAGQTVTVRLYSNGAAVQTGNATADANGIINLPNLAYVFQ